MNHVTIQTATLASPRSNRLIMHVCRNSISLLDVMHRLFFDGLSHDACRKAVNELIEQRFINKYDLWGNRKLYRIGPRAVSAFGWPRKRADRPGPQRLPYLLGALNYTCMRETVQKQLLASELKRKCPWFPDELIHPWAYTWRDEVLRTIRVEPRCGRPLRVVRKLTSQLYQYCGCPEVQRLQDEGRLIFAVVVASDEQARVLRQANHDEGSPLHLETSVYSDLIRFI